MNTFTKNLKRLRLTKNLTQEQAAEALGVSSQSISRWECGTTLPDVTMLPQIARLYCVSIDDLYQETSVAYDNYAQRLGSIYEATLAPEDFVQADQEYRRMLKSGGLSTEDLRLYGILHHHMMDYCIEQSLALFDQALEQGPAPDPEAYWRTKRQKIYLLHQIGRNQENIDTALAAVHADPENLDQWLCLILAYSFAGDIQSAQAWYEKAEAKFPATPMLLYYGGDNQAELGNYDKAFEYWDRCLAMDPDFCDARYAMGECYQRMGEYEKAYEVYNDLADSLARRGYDSEVMYPRRLAKQCKKKTTK